MNNKTRSSITGLALSIFIAAIAFFLSSLNQALDSLVVSILFGIIIGNILNARERIEGGINLAVRVFIPVGITLYGSQLSFNAPLRSYEYIGVILTMALYFIVVLWLSRKLSISRGTGLLIASGSAICGASAIVVLSPIINARKEETSISLISITIVGLTGVIIYPVLQRWFALPSEPYAFLAGSTLPQIGQVKLAASSTGVLSQALQIKLLRVAMLAPIALGLSLSYLRRGEEKGYYMPWFILTFILTAIIFNVIPGFKDLGIKVEPIVKFVFSIAIAGIGLSIDLNAILEEGPKPLFIAFIGWISVVMLFIFFYIFFR